MGQYHWWSFSKLISINKNETNPSLSRDRLSKEYEHGQSHVDDLVETGKLEKTE
jgi:hypothetical protein